MKSILKKVIPRLYEKLILYNNPFHFYGIPTIDYSIHKGKVRLKKLDLEFNRLDGEAVIQGYPFALRINDTLGGKFTIEKGKLMLKIENLKFWINSSEELFIINEVFITEVYRYCCVRDTVFIDIGMNSGIATLFYAQNSMVKKVYAFELFKPTFLLGIQNLKLNEKYAHKVEACNYGLSNKSFEATLDYSISRKGRMGLKGLPGDEHFTDTTKEDVMVKDVSGDFEKIISASADMDIVVKIDCEGEEFNLIDRLAKSGLLGKLTILMIEWHYIRPAEIENHLKAQDFDIFSHVLPTLDSGMIYASKRQIFKG